LKKSFYTIITFARLNTKRYFRDRLAIFFTVVFPLIFLVIFGSLFHNTSNISFNVALINQSKSPLAQQIVAQAKKSNVLKINYSVATLGDAEAKMQRSELDAALVLPQNFGMVVNGIPSGQLVVYYNENDQQAASTLATILQGQFNIFNARYIKVSPPLSVVTKSTNQSSLTQFDYTFSGLLGFAVLALGIFGPVNVFPELKKQGILRRLHTTPLRVWQYFTSNVLSQSVIGLFSIAIMFTVSVLVFHLQMKGSYISFIIFAILSIFTIYGIGLALGGWAKNERQAAPLGNLVSFPMMFLSGTFFPRYLMPEWLQKITNYLPLTPVIDGFRLIVTEGKSLFAVGPQIGLLLIWAVIIYFIAFRIFRWE